jgi:uncharacterized protein YbaP (TraB family)
MRMTFKWFQRGLAALGIAAAASCTTAPPVPQGPHPALWKVADADTTIYLFGTIHLLPRDASWQTPALQNAVAGSQELYVETIVDQANPQTLYGELLKLGFTSGLPPIVDRVPPAKRGLLLAAIAKTGQPQSAFDHLETWAAAFILLGPQFQSLSLSGDQGVETVLRNEFASAGKPIGQLESNVEQLRIFDGLPETAQRTFLEGVIQPTAEFREQFNGMLAAWQRGDLQAIARTFNEDLDSSPELREAMIRRRNANWSQWVQQRLATPGTVMVAVGAGHLAGEASVQQLLEQRGLKVTRIQ